jgi:hypothetical protein
VTGYYVFASFYQHGISFDKFESSTLPQKINYELLYSIDIAISNASSDFVLKVTISKYFLTRRKRLFYFIPNCRRQTGILIIPSILIRTDYVLNGGYVYSNSKTNICQNKNNKNLVYLIRINNK